MGDEESFAKTSGSNLEFRINPNKLYCVSIRDAYTTKRGCGLQPGDGVITSDNWVNKTLPEMEPDLEKDILYLIAKEMLHGKNKDGVDVKKFRILLLEGLAKNTPNLREIIMFETGDFSSQDYEDFANEILGCGVDISKSQVKSWLKGETIATTKDWSNFLKLAQINPKFQTIYDSWKEDAGFHPSYCIYVGTRQYVRRMAEIIKNKGGIKGGKTRASTISGEFSKHSDKIKLIASRVIGVWDEKHSVVTISEIIKGGKRGEYQGTKKPRVASDEFISEEDLPEKTKKKKIPMDQVKEESIILDHALSGVLNKYFKIQYGEKEASYIKYLFEPYLIRKLILSGTQFEEIIFENNKKIILKQNNFAWKYLRLKLHELYNWFRDDLKEGIVDNVLGVPGNTSACLISLVNQYRSTLPWQYFEKEAHEKYRNLMLGSINVPSMNRREKKEVERKLNKMRQIVNSNLTYLQKEHGFKTSTKSLLYALFIDDSGIISNGLFTEKPNGIEDIKRRGIEYKKKQKLFTRDEAHSFLDSLGIGDAINFYSNLEFGSSVKK